jgi:hypothetical protein
VIEKILKKLDKINCDRKNIKNTNKIATEKILKNKKNTKKRNL